MDKKVYVCDEGTCLRFHTSLLVATGSHNNSLVIIYHNQASL